MEGVRKYSPVIGRVLIALIFILFGFAKITDFSSNLGYMQAFNVPFTAFVLVIAIAIELLGGLSLVLGLKTKWGAGALIIYTAIITLIFHTNLADQTQLIQFMKNLAIIGGLILIANYGPGPFSLDKKR
ncbi:MAG: DoxX family protein [Nanoarchaeota archaeon]|nr:DoxX family protein [Nanoarchaeota archaeon]